MRETPQLTGKNLLKFLPCIQPTQLIQRQFNGLQQHSLFEQYVQERCQFIQLRIS